MMAVHIIQSVIRTLGFIQITFQPIVKVLHGYHVTCKFVKMFVHLQLGDVYFCKELVTDTELGIYIYKSKYIRQCI